MKFTDLIIFSRLLGALSQFSSQWTVVQVTKPAITIGTNWAPCCSHNMVSNNSVAQAFEPLSRQMLISLQWYLL